ncbi:MAG: hypothetical protein ACRD29_10855 [Acidimicrobiales bacterium]
MSLPDDSPAPPYSLEQSARRLGGMRWVEQRLFELLGAWAGDVPERAAKPILASHAAHHAWHTEVLADRLPVARGFDADDLTAPPDGSVVAALDAIGEPGPEHTIERLVGVYRVLVPHLVGAYTEHLARLTIVSDRPTIRWIRFIVDDESADLREGVSLLDSFLDGDAGRERADLHEARIARFFADSNGVAPGGTPRGTAWRLC